MSDPERDELPHAANDDVLLSPKEVAKRIGMSISWLAKARARGDGPRFVKYGRSVKYPLSYLLEDMRTCTSSSTSPASSASSATK